MAKLTPNQKKLLARLLERYEAKINKPRADRFVDAQHEAHFIGFEVQEFHDTMKVLKQKGLLAWELGTKRRNETGQEYDYNNRSYYCLISDSGITLARQCRDDLERSAKKLFLPAWQVACAVIALIVSTVVSNMVGDLVNRTPDKQLKVFEHIATELKRMNDDKQLNGEKNAVGRTEGKPPIQAKDNATTQSTGK